MGDKNQIIYLKSIITHARGNILEIGSKDYGNTSSFRGSYPESNYIGIDISPGDNVDIVSDIEKYICFKEGSFSLIICCSVLEHTKKPWKVAENITKLCRKEGYIYISVPWVWRYHPYPDDYFRFSFKGIKELFPEITWIHIHYSTNVIGEFFDINSDDRIDNKLSAFSKEGRKYLPYLNVNMIGRK